MWQLTQIKTVWNDETLRFMSLKLECTINFSCMRCYVHLSMHVVYRVCWSVECVLVSVRLKVSVTEGKKEPL